MITFSCKCVKLMALFGILAAIACSAPDPDIPDSVGISDSAENITALYESNEVAAKSEYTDKWADISGEVSGVEEKGGFFEVTLRGEDFSFSELVCKVPAENIEVVKDLSSGDNIKVRGLILGVTGFANVVVKPCAIIFPVPPTNRVLPPTSESRSSVNQTLQSSPTQQVIINDPKELNLTINDFPIGWQRNGQTESDGSYEIQVVKIGTFIALPEEKVHSWVGVFPDTSSAKEDYEGRRIGHGDRFRLEELKIGDSSYIYEGNATVEAIFRVRNVIANVKMFTQYGGSLNDVKNWANQLNDKIERIQTLRDSAQITSQAASTTSSNQSPTPSSDSTSERPSTSSQLEPTIDVEKMIEAEVQRRLDALVTPVPDGLATYISPTVVPIEIPKAAIQIVPSESTRRTFVNWSATGYSSDSPVIVTYGTERTRVATAISDGSGNASGTFQIPLGSYESTSNLVEATDNSGNTSAVSHTIPNPTISASSSEAPAGSFIKITGHYLAPNRPVSKVTIGDVSVTPTPQRPQTSDLGGLEMELWIPHQVKGLSPINVEIQDDGFIVLVETTVEVTRRLPPTLKLDSYQGIRNSTVKWNTDGGLPNSPLKILYGSERLIVDTSTLNEFGQASGEFTVPADASIPSENQVSAVESTGSSASAIHSVPAASIFMEWSRIAAGSTITLNGKYFPQSESVSVAMIGGKSVLPTPEPITDSDGSFQLKVQVPQQVPGEKTVMIQVGTRDAAIIAESRLLIDAAEPISVGWDEVQFDVEPWEETGRSIQCPEGRCLRASNIPNGSYAVMSLFLFDNSDSRFFPYMERTSVSFEIKTSTESCCDILRVEHDGLIEGSWSGETDWTNVQFELTSIRPTMIQWIYEKDKSQIAGDDMVWIRNVQMK